jgi:hypothetical protein
MVMTQVGICVMRSEKGGLCSKARRNPDRFAYDGQHWVA